MPKRPLQARVSTGSETDLGVPTMLGTARGEILSELCGRRLTALDLADRFSVSSNAIRLHLGALRKAGLVRYVTESRGVGKPTHVYELTPQGQYLISRAYAPALRHLLRAARTRLGGRLDDVVRDAGRSLATEMGSDGAKSTSLRSRAERCAALLRAFGGNAKLEEDSGRYRIRSECCPLASVVADQPVACKLFEGMARELIGREVQEQCERANRPHCVFQIV